MNFYNQNILNSGYTFSSKSEIVLIGNAIGRHEKKETVIARINNSIKGNRGNSQHILVQLLNFVNKHYK